MSKYIYTLSHLRKPLSTHIDIPTIHAEIFSQYKGYDWLHYTRFEKNLACPLPICSTSKRTVYLVFLTPNVIYPLRQVETVRILEGDIIDNMGVERNDHNLNTFNVGKEYFLWNGEKPTSMLCMINHEI